MSNNEIKIDNGVSENKETKTTAERVSQNLKSGGSDDLLKMARRQKAEHDQERAEWELKERERAKNEMELLRENTLTKKELGDLRKEIENLKYKSVLDREMSLASEESNATGEQVKLTPKQAVDKIFMEVIRERKEKALKKKEENKSNVYFI